jgi:TolB-like protein/DNA-binding winged helix-turn-helix (wHTH) protein/Tfp pilus assembly protein PilF
MLSRVMTSNVRRSATRELEVYELSDLVIDVARQRVTRAAAEIALPKLSFDLLLVLIRAAPAVVSNDDLMAQVWSGLVVSPETVSQRVKLLRDVLGDDPRAPRYIAGLRGRGYRLIPEVRLIAENSSYTPPQPSPAQSGSAESPPRRPIEVEMTSQPRARARTRVILGVVAALALMGIATYAVFALRPQPAAPKADSVTVVGLPPRTVAVLPFENLSPDPANDYLALGMAEMVLNRLASVSELVVIARASSFKAAEGSVDARETGKVLNARYLVEGGVQREGEKLRVTARLIDAQSGAQLQALHFDRALADVFSIQDEIAEKVAAALEASLSDTAAEKPGTRSANLNAYLAYLQGRVLLAKYTVDGFEGAIEQFERAIALDPNFAAAYVGLADALVSAAWRRGDGDISKMNEGPLGEKAAALIDKALALDPSLGEAYLVRAHWIDTQEQAEADYRKGLELDPSNGPGLTRFGEFLARLDGRLDEARAMLDRALLIDPLSARAYYIKVNLVETPAEAEQMLLAALQIDPQFTSVLKHLALMRSFQGKFAEGVMLAERAIAADPANQWSRQRQTAYGRYIELGDLAAARDVVAGSEAAGLAPFQVFLYLGDWRAAGEAVYDVPERLRSAYNNWLAAEAVRDLALKTGDFRRAIRFIESGGLGIAAPYELNPVNIYVAVPFAHLLRTNGQRAESEKVLDEALAWVNRKRDPTRDYKVWWPLRRLLADMLALQGNRDAAVVELAEALRSGERTDWWYTIERDPLWDSMRSDPRFQAIATEARAHAAAQRALLEEMRRKGEVPYRPSQQ